MNIINIQLYYDMQDYIRPTIDFILICYNSMYNFNRFSFLLCCISKCCTKSAASCASTRFHFQ